MKMFFVRVFMTAGMFLLLPMHLVGSVARQLSKFSYQSFPQKVFGAVGILLLLCMALLTLSFAIVGFIFLWLGGTFIGKGKGKELLIDQKMQLRRVLEDKHAEDLQKLTSEEKANLFLRALDEAAGNEKSVSTRYAQVLDIILLRKEKLEQ